MGKDTRSSESTVNNTLVKAGKAGIGFMTLGLTRSVETPYELMAESWVTNLPIGQVTVLAERGIGVLRDKKAGSYFKGDQLKILKGGSDITPSISIAGTQCAEGGAPYDNIVAVVTGISQQEAIGALAWFIRKFGEESTMKKQKENTDGGSEFKAE